MTDREQAARRGPQLSDDQPRMDSAAVDGAEDNRRDDIWLANFMSRLTGTLRNMTSRKPGSRKPK
jgi:hypothetical protein